MTPTLSSNLRFGWTTGTCASAAVHASYMALLTGEFPDRVTIVTPSGKNADLEIAKTSLGAGWACAGVVKDAGDDPDVTHGAMICATLSLGAPDSGVVFRQGAGVGIITKAGLPIDVGEPAINPVPRQMMCAVIDDLARSLGGTGDVEIEISVPDGDKIALKTWNPRLGIEGGISILGTTGVVRPFSCSAWIASIHRGIDVARANALPHVIGSTGATSEGFAKERYDLPDIALLDMGDFVGGMLKYMRKNPVPRLTIAGGFGKLVKMAQGAVDLHSARSQVDFEKLALLAEPLGFRYDAVAHANSVLEIVQMADLEQRHALATIIAEQALDAAMAYLKRDDIAVEIFVVSRDGALLGRAGRLEL